MINNFFNNFIRLFLLIFLFNSTVFPVNSSSALAAWALRSDGVLEIKTKSNANLQAYFQKANDLYGDRFWIDFPGELKTPRTIKGNGPIKEIRLGKPSKGITRLVVEFKLDNKVNPYTLKLVGVDQNTWKIKLAYFQKNSFETISEGISFDSIPKGDNLNTKNKIPNDFLNLPRVEKNKFYIVLDPGHGGSDVGAVGIAGLQETDVVLDVSKMVAKLLREKGVRVRMTRTRDIDLDLSRRVSIANQTKADIFVSIHANASRGKKRNISGIETFYYYGWKGKLLAQNIQKELLKVSPGSPDRGVRKGKYYVIRNTHMPAVLVEIGFVTGKLDARMLEKNSHRERVAYAIAKGILRYLLKVG